MRLLLEDARRFRDAARDDVEGRQHRHEDREEVAVDAVRRPHDDEEDEDADEDEDTEWVVERLNELA